MHKIMKLGARGMTALQLQQNSSHKARKTLEKVMVGLLFSAAAMSVFITLAIVLSVLFESFRFFEQVPVMNF